MKKCIVMALILAVFAVSNVCAETLNLTTLPVLKANGYYVGAIGGNINGGTRANYYCDDFATTTNVPSSFTVLVSTLSNISGTKFFSQTDSLKKYQQVGWLMYQMEINPLKTAAIQFAMWSVFTPSSPTFEDSAAWLDASTRIDAASYDFSQMRIYTATNTINQEFVGGHVGLSAVPEPAEWLLLMIGLGLITYSVRRNRMGVIRITA
ncbi:MAG: PEP-CTERM sorting domain-containing protein [Syntrophales bacterium]